MRTCNCRYSVCGCCSSTCWLVRLAVYLLARLEFPPARLLVGLSLARNAPQQAFTCGFHDRPSLKITTKHADLKTPSKALFTGDLIHP